MANLSTRVFGPMGETPETMAVRDTWHRTLVYFGLAEEDDPRYEPVSVPDPEPEAELEDRYRERPNVRILVLTPSIKTARRLALPWGAYPVHTRDIGSFEEMIAKGKRMALRHGFGVAGSKLIALAGVFWFRQSLDLPAIVGMALIIAGVVVVNVFSKSVPH